MFSHELTQSNQSCLSDQMVETKQMCLGSLGAQACLDSQGAQVCLGSPEAQASLDSQGAQAYLDSQGFLSMFLHSHHLEKL